MIGDLPEVGDQRRQHRLPVRGVAAQLVDRTERGTDTGSIALDDREDAGGELIEVIG